MTTSPKPWSTRPVDATNNSTRAELLDATGKVIAFFLDYRNLEAFMEAEQENVTATQELQVKNDRLEDLVADLGAGRDEYDSTVSSLRAKLEAIQGTLNG